MKLLLDRGANVNAQGGQHGNALQAASYGGHEKVVELLLDKGADVNAQGGAYYGNALQAGGFLVPDSESTQAAEVLDRAFDGANRNNLSILFRAGTATVDDGSVRDEITQAESRLAALPGVRHIDSYYQTGTPLLVSRDRHSAITVVTLDGVWHQRVTTNEQTMNGTIWADLSLPGHLALAETLHNAAR